MHGSTATPTKTTPGYLGAHYCPLNGGVLTPWKSQSSFASSSCHNVQNMTIQLKLIRLCVDRWRYRYISDGFSQIKMGSYCRTLPDVPSCYTLLSPSQRALLTAINSDIDWRHSLRHNRGSPLAHLHSGRWPAMACRIRECRMFHRSSTRGL